MPRVPRMYLKTEYFHVMIQGINKSFIFELPEDIKYYIKIMYEFKEKYNIEIISYCIMNNHAHILLQTEQIKSLSEYMHSLNTKYACYYNKKYKRVGYVFKDRYKAEGIYTEAYLYNCMKYIYDNPVKAGMCNKPEEYKYSNYKPMENEICDEDYFFIDIEEDGKEVCERVLNNFLLNNNIKLNELKKNNKQLHRLVVILKRDYRLSLREIATNLNINREKIRGIFNKK